MKIKEYIKIINNIEEKNGNITKLYFVWQAKDFDLWQEMDEKQQEKLIDYCYSYWLDEELLENNIYNVMDVIFNNYCYNSDKIVKNIDTLTYKEFCNIINENM